MNLTEVQNIIKWCYLWMFMLTFCLLLLRAWACEWVKADRKQWMWTLSAYVRHYLSAATLCLFMLWLHLFQLHGPQTRPLIPPMFSLEGVSISLSSCTSCHYIYIHLSHWHICIIYCIMLASALAQSNRSVLLFHESQSSSKHEDDGVLP